MERKQSAAYEVAAGEEEPELFKSDDFRIFCMKVLPCSKRSCHDWQQCPYAHPGEKAKRRDPRVHTYTGIACPNMKQARKCPRGDACPYAHNVFEYWLHPTRYRTQLCKDGPSCARRICFFAHTQAELRTSAEKPHVAPEALAAATAAAALEAARSAVPTGEADQAEVNLLNELLKAHGRCDQDALKHLQMQAAGGQVAQGGQQQQLVDALATLLLSSGLVHQEMPNTQSQPLPVMDDRLDLASMGRFNSVPQFGQARRTSSGGRAAHRSVDLPRNFAALVPPLRAQDTTPDTYDFSAAPADQPRRFSEREEAAYNAGVAAALAHQQQQWSGSADATAFMQSLQQAAREKLLGEGGNAFGAAPMAPSAFAQQAAMGMNTADLGVWPLAGGYSEPEGMDFMGAGAFASNMGGRMSLESSRFSSDTLNLVDTLHCAPSDNFEHSLRMSMDSMRSSGELAPAVGAWSNLESEAAPSQTPFVDYRLSSLFGSSAPFGAAGSQAF
ncbi:probable zinc finger CCCH domain-containing protein 50 at N-terminal half [Coccomyxa sp. Obi]|nr:probable zinc finger CCCH domain-containing protein 50 at N-terminal half [Coccomyxa sp. Obi]